MYRITGRSKWTAGFGWGSKAVRPRSSLSGSLKMWTTSFSIGETNDAILKGKLTIIISKRYDVYQNLFSYFNYYSATEKLN